MLGPFSQYAFCIILLSFFSICEPGISRYSHMSTILSILTYYCQHFNTVVLYCLQIMSFQSMAGLNGEAACFLPLADLVKILTTPGGHRASRGCEQYEQMKHRTHKTQALIKSRIFSVFCTTKSLKCQVWPLLWIYCLRILPKHAESLSFRFLPLLC